MRTLFLAVMSSAIFAAALLATVFLGGCFDVFALGHADEKWGSPWANVQLIFVLFGLLVARSSAVVFASFSFAAIRYRVVTSPKDLALLSVTSGFLAGALSVSGTLKWLSQFIDARSTIQLLSLAALPGLLVVLVLAAVLLAKRKWQRA